MRQRMLTLVMKRCLLCIFMIGLMSAPGCGPSLVEFARDGDLRAVRYHLRSGVPADTTPWGSTALMYAAESGDTTMMKVLLREGADINAANPEDARMSPLMYAAWGCHAPAVRVLLTEGADPNGRRMAYYWAGPQQVRSTSFGDTPLTMAVRKRCFSVAHMLLLAGADPNASVIQEDIALHPKLDQDSRRLLVGMSQLAADLERRSPAESETGLPLRSPLQLAQGDYGLAELLRMFGGKEEPHRP